MLKRVSIQNFKSLKDVTLDLQKVNLLIGPNNSGKTNFLKALEFFKLYADGQADLTENLLFQKNSLEALFIKLSFDNPKGESETRYIHYTLSSSDNLGNKLLKQYNCQYKISNSSELDLTETNPNYSSSDAQKITSTALDNRLGAFTVYKPDPNQLVRPAPLGISVETVDADASNLVSFLDRMLGNQYRKSVFNRIEADLHVCVPEFDEVNLDDASPTEELKRQFGDKSFKILGLSNSKRGITYWADELSEGTLYFIALLCIINQPNPPKLLLLEEPEKGIHPRRIFEVIQFIFRLAEEKNVQVIMTTHSPLVVDMFKDMPESVFIFDKDDEGATHVKNLQHDVIEPETIKSEALGIEAPHYTDSLGDAWTVGFLGGVPK